MANIYQGQPYTIRLETEADLSEATSIAIRIKNKITGRVVFIPAQLVSGSTTAIIGDVVGSLNTEAGPTHIQAWVIFPTDPNAVPGDILLITIKPI